MSTRGERARALPPVGSLLLATAVLHLLATPLFYGEALTSLLDGGVLGAVEADPSTVDLRSSGFWYLAAGLVLVLVGADAAWMERHHGQVPAHVGWLLALVGLFGVVLMPVSPFWLLLLAAALAARSRRGDSGRPSWRSWVAPAAGLFSLGTAAAGGLWASGLVGSPLGVGDPRGSDVTSWFRGLASTQVGWVAVGVGLAGALTALAVWRWPGRRLLAAPALALALTLLLVVPDVRVIQNFAYLFVGYTRLWDAALGAMVISMLGGLLWGGVALAQHTHGRPVAAALHTPRWSVAVTYLAAALALPYGIVRMAWGFGIPLGVTDAYLAGMAWWERLLVIPTVGGLPIAGAVLTLGLIRPWGVVFPRWIPWLSGRRVPIWFAVVPGGIAAVLILQMGLRMSVQTVPRISDMTWTSWGPTLPAVFILPWGVALALAVYAYAASRVQARDLGVAGGRASRLPAAAPDGREPDVRSSRRCPRAARSR